MTPESPGPVTFEHTCGARAREFDCKGCFPPPTHDEAEQIALAYIDRAFNNPEKPGRRIRHSIPANPGEDTDLRLMAYIKHWRSVETAGFVPQQQLTDRVEEESARAEEWKDTADDLRRKLTAAETLASEQRERATEAERRAYDLSEEWQKTRAELAAERAKRERLEEKLWRIREWTDRFGAELKPTGADTYGEGVRACKERVSRILAATPAAPAEPLERCPECRMTVQHKLQCSRRSEPLAAPAEPAQPSWFCKCTVQLPDDSRYRTLHQSSCPLYSVPVIVHEAGFPPFGVDPEDSVRLDKLRRCIGTNLIWRDERQEATGDYEGAVEYSGELATEYLELRQTVARLEAERAALVELEPFVRAMLREEGPMPYRRTARMALDKLDALRSQPSPTDGPWYVVEDDGSYSTRSTEAEAQDLLKCASEGAYVTRVKPSPTSSLIQDKGPINEVSAEPSPTRETFCEVAVPSMPDGEPEPCGNQLPCADHSPVAPAAETVTFPALPIDPTDEKTVDNLMAKRVVTTRKMVGWGPVCTGNRRIYGLDFSCVLPANHGGSCSFEDEPASAAEVEQAAGREKSELAKAREFFRQADHDWRHDAEAASDAMCASIGHILNYLEAPAPSPPADVPVMMSQMLAALRKAASDEELSWEEALLQAADELEKQAGVKP